MSERLARLQAAYDREFLPEPAIIEKTVTDGVVIAFSDIHKWPGPFNTIQRALLYFIAEMKPAGIVLDGDLFDGARVGRHPSIGWEKKPTVIQELRACQEFAGEVSALALETAWKVWPLGNHDKRFESRLALHAPEYEFIDGFHLKDHFSEWEGCWACFVNAQVRGGWTEFRHRMKGGKMAALNNTLYDGVNVVTGHDHRPQVMAFTDRWGTRYGVSLGMLGTPGGPQFVDYTEAGECDWRSAFGVFTYRNGVLLPPELVTIHNDREGEVQFRGEVIAV